MHYKKIPFTESEQILSRVELSSEAQALVDGKALPSVTIQVLFDNQLYIDLTNFIAHALPVRESIWWCCVVLELREQDWSVAERDTLQRCKSWALEPEEVKRRSIEQQLLRLGHDCALGWLAQAVVWNGSGSIAAPDQPQVLPAAYLFAKAVGGAINTAALIPQWQGYQEYYRRCHAIAEDIANGGRGDLFNGLSGEVK